MSNPFNELAHQWWDCNGPFKTLHDINHCRLNFIEQYVSCKNKQILDLGCGGGILTESLARLGGHVTGIDIEANLIEVAKLHARAEQLQIDYVNIAVEQYAEKQFDIIVCMEMLEHVKSPMAIIKECRRLLKPTGVMFLSTINRTIKAYFELILMGEYVLRLLPRQTHDYQQFIQPSELDDYLRMNQLRITHLRGMGYNPLNRTAFLRDNVDVNYLLMASAL